MEEHTEGSLLIFASTVVMTAGLYVGFAPITLAYLGAALVMGILGYIPLREGEIWESIRNSAFSGVYFTLFLSNITSFSFYSVSVLMLVIGAAGTIRNIVTGIRR